MFGADIMHLSHSVSIMRARIDDLTAVNHELNRELMDKDRQIRELKHELKKVNKYKYNWKLGKAEKVD